MRRDVLRRRIESGALVARCAHRYTDDYAGDAADNFGKTEWLPARIERARRRDWQRNHDCIAPFRRSAFSADCR